MKLGKAIITILLISLIIYSGYKVVEKKNIQAEIKDINNNPIIYEKNTTNVISRLQEEYNNKDIVGILKIAGINAILVQTDNNSYYLDHLVSKKQNKTGSIFVDYRTDIKTSKQVNIYGHSSDYYDVLFNRLKEYTNKEFYLENNKAYVYTNDSFYEYEIFSVKITSDEAHLKVEFKNKNEFYSHLIELNNNSLYETGVTVNEEDDILVIQTCINNSPKGDLLIINLRKVG